MAMPVSARLGNVGESDPSYVESATISIFGKIGDFFHNAIAKVFSIFGADCPLCDNHYGYGAAEGEGGYTKEEVLSVLPDLPNLDQKRVRLRNGHDLDNPVISPSITERDRELYPIFRREFKL